MTASAAQPPPTASPVPRREFLGRLAGTGAWLAGVGPGRAENAGGPPPVPELDVRADRKIDVHAHLGFGPTLRLPVSRLLHAADALGIERLVVSVPGGPLPPQFRAGNEVVLDAMRAHPDRLLGMACVNPHHGPAALEEARRCLGEGMCGLGELYTDAKASDPAFFPLVELCIAERALLLWHARADLALVRPGRTTSEPRTTSTAADLVALARRYPEAIIVHGHLGGGGDWEHVCNTLRDAPSVYLDTSGSVSEPGMLEYAVATLGSGRLLFGTDMNFEVGVARVLGAGLDAAARTRIFHGNLNRLLRGRGLDAR